MKLKTLAALALALICSSTFAQQTVKFKIQYLPNHQYNVKSSNVTTLTMNVKADSATLAQMQQSGLKLPLLMKNEHSTDGLITTGALQADKKSFPLSMVYSNAKMEQSINGQSTPLGNNPLNGLTMTGICTTDGKAVFDTTSTDAQMQQIKTVAAKTINSVFSSLKFPDAPMKVGESFEQIANIPLPLPGMTMNFNVKSIYKLLSVSNGVADFDIAISMTFKASTSPATDVELKVAGDGTGGGKFQYDIANSFTKSMQQTLTMNFSMPMPQMQATMSGSANIATNYQVTFGTKP